MPGKHSGQGEPVELHSSLSPPEMDPLSPLPLEALEVLRSFTGQEAPSHWALAFRSANKNSPLGRFLALLPRILALLHLDTLGGNAANFCLALIFTLRRGDQVPNLCCLVPHLPWGPFFPFLLMSLQQCWQLVSQNREGFLCGKAQTWGHLILRCQKNKLVSASLFAF